MAALSCGLGMTAGARGGETYSFTIDAARSALSFEVHDGVHIAGTFIGNYDPANNPGGTKTRNGYFGGKTNEPVPYTTDASVDGTGKTSPRGGFRFTLDPEAGVLTVTGLSLDLLDGAAPTLPLTVALDFDTFRTYSPDSLYIGGLLPPIPVGEATLSTLSAVQSGAGSGTLVPAGNNSYEFAAVVSSDLTVVMSVLGQEVAPGPQPAPLALAGTITVNGNGTATVTMTLEQQIQQVLPLEGVGFENVALDLPTILPPGYTAHLLMSGTVETVTVDMTFGLTIAADGVEACPADFDGNGVLDLFDFLAFQNAFLALDPAADFNGDGEWNLFDFLAYVNAFASGC